MDLTLQTDGPVLAFATYKPKEGKHDALMALVKEHLPTLRKNGLATDKESYLAISRDGTVIEIFEWATPESAGAAHKSPAVLAIWEKMGQVADFVPMNALPESDRPFPNFILLPQL
jgi:hypothetical protein